MSLRPYNSFGSHIALQPAGMQCAQLAYMFILTLSIQLNWFTCRPRAVFLIDYFDISYRTKHIIIIEQISLLAHSYFRMYTCRRI